MLVSLTGFSLFLGIAQAPLAWRMFIISLPAMIVFAWYLSFAVPGGQFAGVVSGWVRLRRCCSLRDSADRVARFGRLADGACSYL